jgi:DNA-binding NarL/FixJ family response regulator
MTLSSEYKKQVLAVVDGSVGLAGGLLNERHVLEKLGQQITRIISASRIEGDEEVASFAMHVNNVIVALASGRLVPDENIRSLLRESFLEIRRSTQDNDDDNNNSSSNRTQIDPAIINKLKSVLTAANTSEKDFIFLSSIDVLYIDADDFVYKSLAKRATDSMATIMKMTSIKLVSNASEARQLLLSSQEKFDVILCETDLPDESGLELIKEFSSRYPVVAISASDDPRSIQLAMKAGATDYIVKNETGIRMLPRSLHTAVVERQKRGQKTQKDEILKDPRAAKVLNYLMISEDSVIEQTVEPSSYYKMQVLEPERDFSDIFATLERAGYVTKSSKRLALCCPRCRSANLVSYFACANCNKSDFIKGDVIEHNRCGYNDMEFAFQKNNSNEHLFCPKCNKELKLIGVDYLRTEAAYKCKECSNIFPTPEQRFVCHDCDNSFRLSEGGWKSMYMYRLNPAKVQELNQKTLPLQSVEEYLSSKGFRISLEDYVDSKLQKFGQFDLVAYKENTIFVMIILGDDIELNHSRIIELDTMSRAVGSRVTAYAITFTELRQVTRDLLSKFGITVIQLKRPDQLLSKIQEYV